MITKQILQNERGVKPTDWIYLQEDLDNYPYLLPLRKAYTKSLLLVGSEKYEDELSKLACAESNRKNLFFYLNSKEEFEEANNIHSNVKEVKVNKVEAIEVDEKSINKEERPIASLPISKLSRLVHFSEIEEEDKTEKLELNSDKEIIHDKENGEVLKISSEASETKEEIVFKKDREKVEDKHPTLAIKDKARTFTDWLSQPIQGADKNTSPNNINPSQNKPGLSKEIRIQNDKISIKPVDQTNKEIDTKARVIDEFLSKNYKPKPQKISKTSSASDNSNSETMSHLMTETLAEIYVEQNKFDKAIKAFTILRLKYPKKSDYFANRIDEIRELKNN